MITVGCGCVNESCYLATILNAKGGYLTLAGITIRPPDSGPYELTIRLDEEAMMELYEELRTWKEQNGSRDNPSSTP